jgi:hypothetical protein
MLIFAFGGVRAALLTMHKHTSLAASRSQGSPAHSRSASRSQGSPARSRSTPRSQESPIRSRSASRPQEVVDVLSSEDETEKQRASAQNLSNDRAPHASDPRSPDRRDSSTPQREDARESSPSTGTMFQRSGQQSAQVLRRSPTGRNGRYEKQTLRGRRLPQSRVQTCKPTTEIQQSFTKEARNIFTSLCSNSLFLLEACTFFWSGGMFARPLKMAKSKTCCDSKFKPRSRCQFSSTEPCTCS